MRKNALPWLAATVATFLLLAPLRLLTAGPWAFWPTRMTNENVAPPGGWGRTSAWLWALGIWPVLAAAVHPLIGVAVAPVMIWMAGALAAHPWALPFRQLIRELRELWSSSPRWRWIGLGAHAALGLAVLTYFFILIVGAFLTLPGGVAAGLLGFPVTLILYTVSAAVAVRSARGRAEADARDRAAIAARVAEVCGVRVDALGVDYAYETAGDAWSVSPTPAKLLHGRATAEAKLASIFPELHFERFDAEALIASPAPEEVLASRALMEASDGLVVAVEDEADSASRPGAARWSLAAGVSPAAGERVDALAGREGLRLVQWVPLHRYAVVAKLTPTQAVTRDTLAGAFGVASMPWMVEVEVDEGTERPIEEVRIVRMPVVDAAKQEKAIAEALPRIPGGHADWRVTDDPVRRAVTLTWAPVRELPPLVPLAELQPARVTPAEWHTLPIGRDDRGGAVSIQLKLGPHALIVGPTGSGKTIELLAHAVSALNRGHELILVDPMKSGVDFAAIRPWLRHLSDSIEDAAATLQAVYAEGQRRKAVLVRHGVGGWADLPGDVRDRESIRPLTVIIDEFTSLVMPAPVPKGLPKDSPIVVEAEQLNAAKAILSAFIGKAARELRFVGIFLALATQRADAAWTGGEMRANLTSRVQLTKPGDVPAREAMAMIFPGEQVQAAMEELATLDDGRSRGLAVVAAEGGSARGLRVAFAEPAEIARMMQHIPQPATFEVPPLDLGGDAPAPAAAGGGVKFNLDGI